MVDLVSENYGTQSYFVEKKRRGVKSNEPLAKTTNAALMFRVHAPRFNGNFRNNGLRYDVIIQNVVFRFER